MMKHLFVICYVLMAAACSQEVGESKEDKKEDHTIQENSDSLIGADTTTTNSVQDALAMDNLEGSTSSGIRYKIQKKGNGGPIGKGGVISFHYKLKGPKGEELRSSYKNVHPYGLKLGLELVPRLLDQCLHEFSYGDQIIVYAPSQHPEMEKFPNKNYTVKDTLQYEIDIVGKPKMLNDQGVKVHWLFESGGLKIDSLDLIGIDYFAFTEEGELFSSSRQNGALYELTVGKSQVPKGLDMVLTKMHQGDKVLVEIPSKWGFGQKGLLDKVAPNTDLTYMITIDYKK